MSFITAYKIEPKLKEMGFKDFLRYLADSNGVSLLKPADIILLFKKKLKDELKDRKAIAKLPSVTIDKKEEKESQEALVKMKKEVKILNKNKPK